VGDARAEVAALAARAGAAAPVLDMVRLAVSEAVSNVVVHGYRGVRPGPVTVSAEAVDHHITVTVTDEGCGLGPDGSSPGAGLGLPIMAEVAESISMSPGCCGRGTRLQMTFGLTG
jgi:anti-sigma regulatory factor (Ser/Thr protein kinase)